MNTTRTRARIFAVLLAALTLCCTACAAADKSLAFDSAPGDMFYANTESVYDGASGGIATAPSYKIEAEGMASSSVSASTNQVLADRKIVKTMRITAETKAFDDATAAIEALCAELGGYIETSSRSGGSLHNSGSVVARSASYTLRIPAEQLDAFRAGMGDTINVVNESTSIDDITDSYFDVDTRLATLRTQEERLLAMLEKATELEYLITLEQRLADVRYQIESYTGTIRRYDSQVAYSTVRLSLDEVIEYTAVTPAPKTFGERMGIAFRDSWADFADGCKDFAIGFVYALPTLLVIAAILAIIVGLLVAVIKRANRGR
ncbi:MAG: DUF4349 domain-containing protein [Clostridia bacterium]|nr:DUF4349 domain-containing protein [Clostridia bacterium]